MLKANLMTKVGVVVVAYAKVFGKTKPLNDGTMGYRFDAFGVQGCYRKRSVLKRYGMTKGPTTNGYHHGKVSVYFERGRNEHPFWSFAY